MTARKARIEAFLAKARNGEFPMGVNFVIPSPDVAEIVAAFPFEWYIVDQEHTQLGDRGVVVAMARVLEPTGKPWFVKLNSFDPLLARDALDYGAYGLMVPFVRSAAQLTEFMDAIRFAPCGTRGLCSLARATKYGVGRMAGQDNAIDDFIEFVNNEMLVIPTVESLEAVENLDELLALDEFECWHIGVEDLVMGGRLEGYDARWALTLARTIAKKMREAGKLTIFGGGPQTPRSDAVERLEALNVDIPYTPDSFLLGFGAAEMIELAAAATRTLGPSSDRDSDVG